MDLLLLLVIAVAVFFSARAHLVRQQQRVNALQLVLAILLDEETYRSNREGMLETLRALPPMDEPHLLMRAMQEADYAARTSARETAEIIRRQLPPLARGI